MYVSTRFGLGCDWICASSAASAWSAAGSLRISEDGRGLGGAPGSGGIAADPEVPQARTSAATGSASSRRRRDMGRLLTRVGSPVPLRGPGRVLREPLRRFGHFPGPTLLVVPGEEAPEVLERAGGP